MMTRLTIHLGQTRRTLNMKNILMMTQLVRMYAPGHPSKLKKNGHHASNWRRPSNVESGITTTMSLQKKIRRMVRMRRKLRKMTQTRQKNHLMMPLDQNLTARTPTRHCSLHRRHPKMILSSNEKRLLGPRMVVKR